MDFFEISFRKISKNSDFFKIRGKLNHRNQLTLYQPNYYILSTTEMTAKEVLLRKTDSALLCQLLHRAAQRTDRDIVEQNGAFFCMLDQFVCTV